MKDLTKQRQDSVSDKASPRYIQSRYNTGYALNKAGEVLPTTRNTTECPFWIEVAKKSKIGFDDCYPHPPREPSSPVSLYNYDGEYPPDQQRDDDDDDTEKSVVLPYVINVWDVARSTIFLDEDDMTYLRDGTRDLSSCFRWNTVKERRTAQVVTTTTTKQRIRPSSIVLPSPRTTKLHNSNNNNNNNKESTRDRPYYLEPALGSSRKGTVVPSLQKGEAFSFDDYGNDDEDTSSMENTRSGDQKKLGPHQGSF